jgi:hypothetical protein
VRPRFLPAVERLESQTLLSGPGTLVSGPLGAFTASLGTDQATYPPGQPVTFTYTQANTSGHVAFTSNGPSINGFVVMQGGKVVWQSNAGSQPPVIWDMAVLSNGSINLTATWDGHSAGGGTPTGTFQVYNQLDQTLLDTFTIAPTVPTVRTPPPPATQGQRALIGSPGNL